MNWNWTYWCELKSLKCTYVCKHMHTLLCSHFTPSEGNSIFFMVLNMVKPPSNSGSKHSKTTHKQ